MRSPVKMHDARVTLTPRPLDREWAGREKRLRFKGREERGQGITGCLDFSSCSTAIFCTFAALARRLRISELLAPLRRQSSSITTNSPATASSSCRPSSLTFHAPPISAAASHCAAHSMGGGGAFARRIFLSLSLLTLEAREPLSDKSLRRSGVPAASLPAPVTEDDKRLSPAHGVSRVRAKRRLGPGGVVGGETDTSGVWADDGHTHPAQGPRATRPPGAAGP